MVAETKTIVKSDLSGKEDAQTRTFGFGEFWYEVDLTDAEHAELDRLLAPYLKIARKTGLAAKRTVRIPAPSDTTPTERDAIRAWAPTVGAEVAPRGRVPKPSIDRWRAEVRAWAAETGVRVAADGSIPDRVIAQWREARGIADAPASGTSDD